MEKLHCPKCHSDHVITQSRRKYFSLAVLCLVVVSLSYVVLKNPLLKPGEFDSIKMGLMILAEAAFCIALILAIYYFIIGIVQKHISYKCPHCDIVFDANTAISHHVSGK